MPVLRLGYHLSPFDLAPRDSYKWSNRFDDFRKEFRSLYCADLAATCIRELVADLRPNARAIADFESFVGGSSGLLIAGFVSWDWRSKYVIVEGEIEFLNGRGLCDIEDPAERIRLERMHAQLLADNGLDHLDLGEMRLQRRDITQSIARTLFEEGFSGVSFQSRLDGGRCYALFEGRAILAENRVEPVSMTDHISDLCEVCGEYMLVLEHR